ncbi:DoxX family protein [Cumulibacter soli]|uniref:DoxX family protein n=1 Tax=Cumulibacter soli TaxID=2546344 RepID=UPI0010684ED4|nr:DoxX family protein [Cumulibacter soli]
MVNATATAPERELTATITPTEHNQTDSGITTTMLGLLRIAFGWVLLWAGLDKIFGLGYPTESGQGIVDGGSVTEGYLSFGVNPDSPVHGMLTAMAGNPIADGLYLAATLGAGIAVLLGVFVRIAAIGGSILMFMLWLSMLPLENNPFMDQHLLYALVGVAVALTGAGRYLGLGRWWASTSLVRAAPWLK